MIPTVTAPSPAVLSATFSNELLSGSTTLDVQWLDVADPSNAQTNLNALGIYQGFEHTSAEMVADGLALFAGWADTLNDSSMLGRSLPLLGTQLQDTVDIVEHLESRLVSIGAYASAASLADKLISTGNMDSVDFYVDADQLLFQVGWNTTLTRAIELDLGSGSGLNIRVQVPDLTVSAELVGQLTFGVDFSIPWDPMFFVGTEDVNVEFAVNVALDLPTINVPGNSGFVSLQVHQGSAAISAGNALDLLADGPNHRRGVGSRFGRSWQSCHSHTEWFSVRHVTARGPVTGSGHPDFRGHLGGSAQRERWFQQCSGFQRVGRLRRHSRIDVQSWSVSSCLLPEDDAGGHPRHNEPLHADLADHESYGGGCPGTDSVFPRVHRGHLHDVRRGRE